MKDFQKGLASQIDSLMQTEVSRGEFLKYMGAAVFGVVGITGLLHNLRHAIPAQARLSGPVGGYGRGAYGR